MMFWRMTATVRAGQLDQRRQVAQRIAQDDQIARLGREVGADPAERDPGVGLRQGRGVVDAVADHRHFPARLLLFLDPPGLVGRQELGQDRLDVNLPGDAPRHRLAIAREQGDLAESSGASGRGSRRAPRAGPCRADRSCRRSHHRPPRSARSRPGHRAPQRVLAGLVDRELVLGQQPPVADEDPDVASSPGNSTRPSTPRRGAREPRRPARGQARAAARRPPRPRARGCWLDCSTEAARRRTSFSSRPGDRDQAGEPGLALGQGSRLVEGKGVAGGQPLERIAALDQDRRGERARPCWRASPPEWPGPAHTGRRRRARPRCATRRRASPAGSPRPG